MMEGPRGTAAGANFVAQGGTMSIIRIRRPFRAGILVLAVLAALSTAPAQNTPAGRVDNAIQVIRDFTTLPEKGIPQALLSKIQGIAVFPGVLKAAFTVGGQYGRGLVMVRGANGQWSDPMFVRIYGGSVGWQIGVQKTDLVLVFRDAAAVKNIAKGKITLGVDASIAAGPVGRAAQANTDLQMNAEIYSYSRSKGIFAGIAINGATVQPDSGANRNFYGNATLTPDQVLAGQVRRVPRAARDLVRTMDTVTAEVAAQR